MALGGSEGGGQSGQSPHGILGKAPRISRLDVHVLMWEEERC